MKNASFPLKNTIAPLTFAALFFASPDAQAQGNISAQSGNATSQHSVRPVRNADKMWKKGLWFRMDLRNPRNLPLFAANNEISRLLIEATKKGIITPYRNDSLQTVISLKDFNKNLQVPGQEMLNGQDVIGEEDCEWGDCADKKKKAAPAPTEYLPREVCQLEIREDMFFDTRHSKMKHDVLSITLIIPGDKSPTGLDKYVATYSYKELCQKLFKNNPSAIWYNVDNQGAHMDLASAFDLRLYYANVVKFENAEDAMITEMYGEGKQAFYAGQEIENKIMEFESNLWSH